MAESKVVPLLFMNDATLRRRIARVAADSSRVFVTPHAKSRMKQRGVLRTQLQRVLQNGNIVESAHRNVRGNWQCTLEAIDAGDRIRTAVALEHHPSGELVIVITVMN
jgi:hypothetical protein